jgi:DNA-binding MarR family transcriptional regulator
MFKSVDKVNHSGRRGEDDVLDLVHTVMHLYRSQQYQVLRDGPHDITHMESKVLWFFGRHPGSTQSDIVAHSGRDKAQMARLIKGLRERGLLEARADEEDRRNTKLFLTDDGVAVQRALSQQAKKVSAKAVAGLNADERDQLRSLLQRVKINLAAE